jgi:hypothetical protein
MNSHLRFPEERGQTESICGGGEHQSPVRPRYSTHKKNMNNYGNYGQFLG